MKRSKRSAGSSLVELLLVIAGMSAFGLAVWGLSTLTGQHTQSSHLAASVSTLRTQIEKSTAADPDFKRIMQPDYLRDMAMPWGVWQLVPLARVDPDGSIVQAGGYRIALQRMPTELCVMTAVQMLREGATVSIDDRAVEDPAAAASACGAGPVHRLDIDTFDQSKQGPAVNAA